jgi:hypothetical protein
VRVYSKKTLPISTQKIANRVFRDPQLELQDDAALAPLLAYVENLEQEIHRNPSDKCVAEITKDNFSPDLLVGEDTTLLGFNAFKMFNTTFWEDFTALKTMDRKPVIFKSDKAGKGGVVGFTMSWLLQQKKDEELFDGDTMYDIRHSNLVL